MTMFSHSKNFIFMLTASLSLIVSITAKADDFGCKVMLCLSDSRGAETEVECRPPIEELKAGLVHGKPFPRCDEAGSDSSMKQVFAPYDDCPANTIAGPANTFIAVGIASAKAPFFQITSYVGMNAPVVSQYQLNQRGYMAGPKACVGNRIGAVVRQVNPNDRFSPTAQIQLYDRVVWMPLVNPPTAIEVSAGGQVINRTRIY